MAIANIIDYRGTRSALVLETVLFYTSLSNLQTHMLHGDQCTPSTYNLTWKGIKNMQQLHLGIMAQRA